MNTFLIALAAFQAQAVPCQVRLTDSLNHFVSTLESRSTPPRAPETAAYAVTDKLGTAQAVTVRAAFVADGPLRTDVGVPASTAAEIQAKYTDVTQALLSGSGPVNRDGQLTWELVPGTACTPLDLGLIQFFVMEWFYFG